MFMIHLLKGLLEARTVVKFDETEAVDAYRHADRGPFLLNVVGCKSYLGGFLIVETDWPRLLIEAVPLAAAALSIVGRLRVLTLLGTVS